MLRFMTAISSISLVGAAATHATTAARERIEERILR